MNEPQQPTEEQLLEALKQIKTEDVVLQTVATLVNLAGQKLSVEGAKDPVEAKKAIDAARQMVPLATLSNARCAGASAGSIRSSAW